MLIAFIDIRTVNDPQAKTIDSNQNVYTSRLAIIFAVGWFSINGHMFAFVSAQVYRTKLRVIEKKKNFGMPFANRKLSMTAHASLCIYSAVPELSYYFFFFFFFFFLFIHFKVRTLSVRIAKAK